MVSDPVAQFKDILSNDRRYIESFMKIEDKDRVLVPFKFNRVQDHFFKNMTGRDIICKASQLGFTSAIVALFLKDCMTRPGTTSVIVAHEEFITQRLLNKAKFFESLIPEGIKPKLHHRSTYELSWEDINSTFYIGSARAYIFGRGEVIHNFHASEIAFWADPERIMVPTLQRVPLNGRVIMESTPYGEGTYYHHQFKQAEEGRSRFKAHFYPWWWAVEYSIGPDSPAALPGDKCSPLKELQPDELKLMELHQLTENQIRWRRSKISEIGQMFFQEYPEDTETCFFTSTEMVHNKITLDTWARGCYPAPYSFEQAQVWFPPEENGAYIVSVDPTVGVTNKAAATVWSTHTEKFRHCATLKGLYDPVVLSDKIKSLAQYYNQALLVIEANNPGLVVISQCVNGDNPYRNLYFRRDMVTGAQGKQVGWLTTPSTKPFAITKFEQSLDHIETYDIDLVREARNQRYVGMIVESMGEDDIYMSAIIANAVTGIGPTIKKGLVGQAGWKRW